MESRDRAEEVVTQPSAVQRLRLVVACLVLTTIAMVQQPGRIVSDTKVDLVVNPGQFMERATTLWDPVGYFGQVQNQAYGYFLPMGPFFWSGHELGIEPWIIQRLWWALILCVAFMGAVLLARELSIGTPTTRLIGGLAFALSPRMLSVLGPSSIEVWPMAVAPWVLLAVVIGSTRRSPVGMAALSALAVAMVGGVNAAATFAVIPLPAIWLLMSSPSRRRRLMLIFWPGFVLLGTIWWLGPLVILGRYSPPFLDFIESSSLTTFDTNALNALRGTSNWTSYLADTGVAGRNLVSDPILLLNLAVVLALSVAGLAMRDLPHRRFLFVAVLVGLGFVTLGHTETHGGLGAPQIQSALDGVLAPLRNTHKFDVVIRLPLVLAFVHVLTLLTRRESTDATGRKLGPLTGFGPGIGVGVLAMVALAGATTPAWTGQIAPKGSFVEVPNYWNEAATYLADRTPQARSLVVPASPFGNYLWGSTNDDVFQSVAQAPWGVRNAIPLAPPGNIRMLDAVEREFSDGRGSPALERYLLDSGVSYLIVRNDLRPSGQVTDPELVYEALAHMPGTRRVASFGPTLGGEPTVESPSGEKVFIDKGWQAEHQAVEIYQLGNNAPVRAQPAFTAPVVIGSAESHIGLLESGLVSSQSVQYAQDLESKHQPGPFILTDGQRRQEVAFGRTSDNRSASLARTDRYSSERRLHDYEGKGVAPWTTTPVLVGAKRIGASSTQSSAASSARIDMAAQPWSAFDGDPRTSWRAAPEDIGRRSWIRVEFDEPVDVSGMTIAVDRDPLTSVSIVVRTDTQSARIKARGEQSKRVIGLTHTTRAVTVSAPSTFGDLLAVSEIRIPGVSLSRPLRLPSPPKSWGSPHAILLETQGGYRAGCLTVATYVRCAQGEDGWGEDGRVIDREMTLPAGRNYDTQLTVEPIGGVGFDEFLQQGQLETVTASSHLVRNAQASALQAADGSMKTSWIANAEDPRPSLTLAWVGEREVSRLTVRLDPLTAASRPTQVTLVFGDGTRQSVRLDELGQARFKPVRTDRVLVEVTGIKTVQDLDSAGGGQELPVGVSEIRLDDSGLPPIVLDRKVRTYPCGSGPAVVIDGVAMKSRVVAAPNDLKDGSRVPAEICGHASLKFAAGVHRIRIVGTDAFRPVRLALGPQAPTPETTDVAIGKWGSTQRELEILDSVGPQVITVTENTNPGWTAPAGAVPIVVNGWQQGWRMTPSDPSVGLNYGPTQTYQRVLLLGSASLFALLVITLILVRRPGVDGSGARREFGQREVVLAVVVTVGTTLFVAGLLGATFLGLGYAMAGVFRHRLAPAMIAGGLVGVAACASAIRPWGGSNPWLGSMSWPQMVIAGALGVAAASVFGLPHWRKRPIGVSTHA